MSEPRTPIAPLRGEEHAIPWATPPIPGTELLTFRGSGDAVTEAFVLPGDASVRVTVEGGPFALRVLRPDGTEGAPRVAVPHSGLALSAVPQGGTYTLEVLTSGPWGVTIVYLKAGAT